MSKPIYGRVQTVDEAITNLQDKNTLANIAYVMRDWVAISDWLTEQGVPDKTEDGVWMSAVERVKWLCHKDAG